jgi:hypothetical protein
MGRLGLSDICTEDIFEKIDGVSLGILPQGMYTVILIGKNFVYYDTLHVPAQAPDTCYQFRITVIDISTHQPVPDLPIELWIDDTAFTQLYDTTNMIGTVSITYLYDLTDTLQYDILVEHNGWPGYFGQTHIVKGTPEVINLGIAHEY